MNQQTEYQALVHLRNEIISTNRSRLMSARQRGVAAELLPVPSKPKPLMGYEALESDGTYIGFYRTSDRADVVEELTALGYKDFKLKQKSY